LGGGIELTEMWGMSAPLILKRSGFELLEGTAELVGTRGALGAASDAIELMDDIVDALTCDQLADTLKVAVAPSEEKHLLDDIILVGSHINQFRACARRFVLYMLCLHTLFISLLFIKQKSRLRCCGLLCLW